MGDEVDDAPDALHVALFSGFDLRVDGGDDLILGRFALGEVVEDAEAIHHAAWGQFDGSGVVPFLQPSHGVRSWEASASSCDVDVHSRPLFGGLARLFECLGYRRAVRGPALETWSFGVFVFGILWRDGPDEVETKFELRVQEIQCIFLS